MNAPQPQPDFISQLADEFSVDDFRMPTLPDAVLYMQRAIADDSLNLSRLTELLHKDPVLATRLVRVANSPFYRGVTPIESVGSAVMRVGFTVTRNTALVLLGKSFTARHALVAEKIDCLWEESLQLSAICRVLAAHFGCTECDRGMLAGLICNVGSLLLLTLLDQKLQKVGQPAVIEILLNRHSPEFGRRLLTHWAMDLELITVAEQHIAWQREHEHMPDLADLVMAARCCRRYYTGTDDKAPLPEQLPAWQRLQKYHFRSECAETVIAAAADDIDEMMRLLIE